MIYFYDIIIGIIEIVNMTIKPQRHTEHITIKFPKTNTPRMNGKDYTPPRQNKTTTKATNTITKTNITVIKIAEIITRTIKRNEIGKKKRQQANEMRECSLGSSCFEFHVSDTTYDDLSWIAWGLSAENLV